MRRVRANRREARSLYRPLLLMTVAAPVVARMLGNVAAFALLLTSALARAQDAGSPVCVERDPPATVRPSVTARHFMVSAAHPLAVEAGYRILKQGGSAVDAAITVQLVLGLVEPQSSGIGGGAFMLVHDAARNKLIAYDGRETAPASVRPELFLDASGQPIEFLTAVIGGKSVGVPGVVALLAATHRKHGRLPWQRLVAPAIELAEKGFPVTQRLCAVIAREPAMPQARAYHYFRDTEGRPLAPGTLKKNPEYAAALREIAARGAPAFYHGRIARDIVDTVATSPVNPGAMTMEDLARYRIEVREPVCERYRGYRVCGMPPPSSGGMTVLQILRILEPYDVAAMGPLSMWSVHFFTEAGRLAYADRDRYMADPAFAPPPAGLVDGDYLAARSALIRTDTSMRRAAPGKPPGVAHSRGADYGMHPALELPSTSHFSIVDRYGNAVAMTTSIEHSFGSRLMTASGFLLNNELTDFSFLPTRDGKPVANRIEAGKRPRSSMSPTIVYDKAGRVFLITGSMFGPTIPNQVAKSLVAVIDWGLDPQAAVSLPNFGSRNGPTELERDTSAAALAPKLQALGHDTVLSGHTGGAHMIVRTGNGWSGGADPRREGIVLGD
jgi:gamma-glutamyltranspeptidase/glutathione hydrolase